MPTSAPASRRPFWILFLALLACYQAAEGIGTRLLHSALWQGLFMLAVVPLGLLLASSAYRTPLRSFALEPAPRAGIWLGAAFAAALLAKALALAAGQALGFVEVVALPLPGAGALLAQGALTLFMTFVPSLAEDVLTRGLWFRHGPVRSGIGFVLLSTAVYVLNHVYRLANGPGEWFMLACFGLAYATALLRTGTLWAAVGLHWGWNAANGLLGMAVDVTTVQRPQAMLLSAAAHLALLALVLLATGARRGAAAAPASAA